MTWKEIESAKVHRLFYPQVPVVVTAEFQGRIGGMPAIWCMPLSFRPSLVGVAVAPEHETYKMIAGTQSFGMNWLNFSYAEQVSQLGEISGKEQPDKLSAVGLTTVKGKRTSQPLIKEASATLECRLLEKHLTGTHELLVGEVVTASASEDFDDYWDFSKYNPLLYAGTVDEKEKFWVFMSGEGRTVKIPLRLQT